MVAIKPSTNDDPTLAAMNRMIEEEQGKHETRRGYLGMSAIGGECSRALWYGFRWVTPETFDAGTLKKFDDGHRSEDIQADRLRLVDGVKLTTVMPGTNKQIEYSDLGGHFKGHGDGEIIGIYQAPKTNHIWEHKATNEAKKKKLDKLKSDYGEKNALAKWDTTYHVQGILYMHYGKITRHYLTCSTPGTRDETSVRTDSDKGIANQYIEKARRIIEADEPPEPISQDRTYFKCKSWCNKRDICMGVSRPDRNCRTCTHSTPIIDDSHDAPWTCARDRDEISDFRGCEGHRYIPALVPGTPIDANPEDNWVLYELPNGSTWKDEGQ